MMKNKRIVLVACCLILTFLLASCTAAMKMNEFESAIQFLLAREPIYATAVTSGTGQTYGTEEVYICGENYLHVMQGPSGSWESTELYFDNVLYSGITSNTQPEIDYPMSRKGGEPKSDIPWLGVSWEDVRDSVVSVGIENNALKIVCQQGECTVTYNIKDGKPISIIYTGTERFNDECGSRTELDLTRTFIFDEISEVEVMNVLGCYLELANK